MEMRRLMRLVEAWYGTHRINHEDVEVFINPSRGEAFRMMKQFNAPLRADLLHQTKDLLVWNSELAMHSDLMIHHGMSELFLYLHPNQIQMNDIQHHREDSGVFSNMLIWRMEEVLSNPNILRIYPRPNVVMLDNETGEMHTLTRSLIDALRKTPVARLSELGL